MLHVCCDDRQDHRVIEVCDEWAHDLITAISVPSPSFYQMADLYKLEFLSLVAKITQEISNHTGINDKTLAEFVINLHDQSDGLDAFAEKLAEVGADFPPSVVQNLDRLILRMHPKHKKSLNTTSHHDTNGAPASEK